MARRSATLLGVDDYDNPETIRFKKYATGGSEDKKMLILNAGHMSLMARKNPGRASATGCGHAQGKRHPSFTQTASIFPAGTAILGSAANAAVDRHTYLGALRRNTGPVSVSGGGSLMAHSGKVFYILLSIFVRISCGLSRAGVGSTIDH